MGKRNWGFPSSHALPYWGLSPLRGGGLASFRTGFQPANDFSGSRQGPVSAPVAISKRECCYPLLGAGPKDRGFLSAPPSTVVCLSGPPGSPGPAGTVLTTKMSLPSLSS